MTPPPPPPPPLFSFLKTIQCLAVTFNFGSKCGTKDRCNGQFFPQSVFSPGKEWAKCGVQCLNSPSDFGLSLSSTPPESRGGSTNKPLGSWGVNHRDAHAYLQLFGISSRFAMKKIDQLYFYLCFVFSKGKKYILRVKPNV